MGKILGLDIGTKRIGLAISDELLMMAHSLTMFERSSLKDDLQKINGIVRENGVFELVVGLPINMDGTYSAKTKEVIEFMDALSKEIGIPLKTWDERLTTVQAERTLLEADISRAKRKKLIDKMAAQVILQGYLDARKAG